MDVVRNCMLKRSLTFKFIPIGKEGTSMVRIRAVVSHTPTKKIAYLSYLLGLLLIVLSHFLLRQRCGGLEDIWKFSEINHGDRGLD